MKVPNSAGKISANALIDVNKMNWADDMYLAHDNTLYKFEKDGHIYDFLWSPKPSSKNLFVFFSGDAMRKTNSPPVFQRWSWASHFPGHCIYFSDPALYMRDDIGLAWYAGTIKTDFLSVIATLIMTIADKIGIDYSRIYTYGSSGGGFASIRLGHFIPASCNIAINPQTSILSYEYKSVDRYLELCLGMPNRITAMENFKNRLDLTASPEKIKDRSVIYAQNLTDLHHYNEHYLPFCASIGVAAKHDPLNLNFSQIQFNVEGGHSRAESSEVLSLIFQRLGF
jgi:hypothetical protein